MCARSIVLCLLGIISTPSPFAAAQTGPKEPQRTITVSGEAVVFVKPSEASVSLGIVSFDDKLAEAKSANDAAAARLLAAIKALSIDEKDISTDEMHIAPELRRKNDKPTEEIVGYTARRGFVVKLRDVKKVQPMIDAAFANGANRLDGLSFSTTELRKFRDQARAMAIKAAREKATLLAGELDCKIGRPLTINEGANDWFGYRGWYGRSYGQWSQNVAVNAPSGGDGEEVIPLGQIEVRGSVSVTFELN